MTGIVEPIYGFADGNLDLAARLPFAMPDQPGLHQLMGIFAGGAAVTIALAGY